ncbi:MAG: hypothetical protein P8J87_04605 [Verrucomicrobiales bacterium]|nr:hypothetical protein [Verrucomicrobiales bacterium]
MASPYSAGKRLVRDWLSEPRLRSGRPMNFEEPVWLRRGPSAPPWPCQLPSSPLPFGGGSPLPLPGSCPSPGAWPSPGSSPWPGSLPSPGWGDMARPAWASAMAAAASESEVCADWAAASEAGALFWAASAADCASSAWASARALPTGAGRAPIWPEVRGAMASEAALREPSARAAFWAASCSVRAWMAACSAARPAGGDSPACSASPRASRASCMVSDACGRSAAPAS